MIIWLAFVLHHLLNVGAHVLDGSDIQGEEKCGFSQTAVLAYVPYMLILWQP